MKKNVFIIFVLTILLFSFSEAHAQLKVHSNGQVSFQSATTHGGIQINSGGQCSFEPNITNSGNFISKTMVLSQLVKAWVVKDGGDPVILPEDRFYVTGLGDAYAHGHYIISLGGGGGNDKGFYPIENASKLLSGLNGYYYDNHDFDDFEPDFVDNPNILPEAVEGMMKDLAIDKSLGLSAEDLEFVLPEAIRHDPEGMVYINYSAIIPVLVEAFKEQQARIEQLESILRNNGLLKP